MAAQRAKSAIFLLHIHSTQEAFSWHIDYSIHYVMHGYIHLLHREDQARLSLPVKLHVLVWENPSFVLSRKPGDEATRAIAEAQAEVAGARAPVCHSLATPLTPCCMLNFNIYRHSVPVTSRVMNSFPLK